MRTIGGTELARTVTEFKSRIVVSKRQFKTRRMSAASTDLVDEDTSIEVAAALRRERVKRYRRRVRNGGAVLKIEIDDYNALVSVLLDAGWLQLGEADDRKQVEAAVAAALAELARWHVRRASIASSNNG